MAATTTAETTAFEFFVDGRDNGVLGKVCEYLDPVSLHAWGQAVLTATKGRAAGAALLEDIGAALLDRTILPSNGFTCVNFQDLFQDPEVLSDEESKPESEEEVGSCYDGENLERWRRLTVRPNSNWTRKRHFIGNSKYKYNAREYEKICQMLTCCFEKVDGLKDLNDAEVGYLNRFLAVAVTKALDCSQFWSQNFVCLEAVVEALCLLNVKLTFPLENSYTLNLIRRIVQTSYTKKLIPSAEVIGSLGELANFNRTFFNGQSPIRVGSARVGYPVDPLMEDKLSHEETVAQLQAFIEKHLLALGEPNLEHFQDDIMDDLRRDLRVQREETDAMYDPQYNLRYSGTGGWERIVEELQLTGEMIEDRVRAKAASRRSSLESFSRETLPSLSPDKAYTDPRVKGDQLQFRDTCVELFPVSIFSRSASNLLQCVVEDFARGQAVKPFLVRSPEVEHPLRCHLVLGPLGTTMFSFEPTEDGTKKEINHEEHGRKKGYGRKRLGL